MRKAVIALLCVCVMLFGGVVYADDSITISQTNSFEGTSITSRSFSYTLEAEEPEGIDGIEKGVEGGVVLQTETLDFSLSDGKKQTKPITMSFDVTPFDHAGTYRYRLTNTSQNEYRLLDVTVLYDNGQLVLSSYHFYTANGVKDTGFIYVPAIVNSNIIFRFVDTDGTQIADDIVFTESHEPFGQTVVDNDPVVLEPLAYTFDEPVVVEKTNTTVVKGVARFNEPMLLMDPVNATSGSDAYGMYEVTLQGLLDKGYSVVKDEVAEHGNTGSWAKQDGDNVYTVTMMNSPVAYTSFNVKIAKVSSGNIKYYLKGAEFTLYDTDGNIVDDINGNPCVGLTDANGNLEFTVPIDGREYYIQETKAPAGYEINPDKFYITPDAEGVSYEGSSILVPITVKDNPLIIFPPSPKTGDNINLFILAGIALVGITGLTATIIVVKKKKGNTNK